MAGRLYPISFLLETAALSADNQAAFVPVTGLIRQITISWPDGCNFLVEAIFRKGKIQFYPQPSLGPDLPKGVSLNDHTLTVPVNYPIQETDTLELGVINHDGSNSHTISAVALIEAE